MIRSFSAWFLIVGSFVSAAASAVPVYRYYNGRFHFYTTDTTSGVNGYYLEGEVFQVHRRNRVGRAPLFRCLVPAFGAEFLSSDANCEGQRRVALLGFISTQQEHGAQPLYRCFQPATGDHLSTKLVNECYNAGYNVEGAVGFVR